jgi:transcriptional regulator with XRE-family HTH domain
MPALSDLRHDIRAFTEQRRGRQAALARLTGLTAGTVSHWTQTGEGLSADNVLTLREAFLALLLEAPDDDRAALAPTLRSVGGDLAMTAPVTAGRDKRGRSSLPSAGAHASLPRARVQPSTDVLRAALAQAGDKARALAQEIDAILERETETATKDAPRTRGLRRGPRR